MVEWSNGRMDGWMDRWIGGWMAYLGLVPAFCLVGRYLEYLPGASLHHHDRLVETIDDAKPLGG